MRASRATDPVRALGMALALLATGPVPALSQERAAPGPAVPHLVVVVGLGGDRAHRDRFHHWATRLVDAARGRGLPDAHVTYLGEKPALDPRRIDARSTLASLREAVRRLSREGSSHAPVFLVLIGHGNADARGARFNLPGPDVTPGELAGLLDDLGDRPVAVIHTGSSSGAFLEPLAGENRTVITATRSGRERNETRFGEHFAAAYAGDGADADKDGRVSLLEAFEFARRETARAYEEENLLLTEHALLDGDGDGEGVPEPTPTSADGSRAAGLYLAPPSGAVADGELPDDPELRTLYRERAALEREIADLRARKDEMERTEYESRLEELLVELALKRRAIRSAEEGTP